MIILKDTTSILKLLTSSSASVDFSVSYVDITSTTFVPSSNEGNIASATTTTILAAPAGSTQRQVKYISIRNNSTSASQVITAIKEVSAVSYNLTTKITLAAGESCQYTDGEGWTVFDFIGRAKTTNDTTSNGSTGFSSVFYKSGSSADTAGYWYCTSKDTGSPGALTVGTPGVNGRAVTYEAGGITLATAGAGTLYLTNVGLTSSLAHGHMFFDLLWINSGLAVTAASQGITTPTLPARDLNGGTNGVGCMIGLLVTAATTNGAAVSNSTVTYTNSNGDGSRVATLAANTGAMIPATCVQGTIVWFLLAGGDTGVQSIQSIALNTTLSTGSISLLIARPIIHVPVTTANIGNIMNFDSPGIKIWPNSCILHCYLCSTTTASTIAGTLVFQEK